MTTDLIEEIQDGVATLTMNRPESLNALSGGMMQAMLDALLRYSVDPDVRVIVLTGAGRGFCAGGDVKGMAANNAAKAGKNRPASIETKTNGLRASMEISKLLHECPKPTIAKVRGPAAGAGYHWRLPVISELHQPRRNSPRLLQKLLLLATLVVATFCPR